MENSEKHFDRGFLKYLNRKYKEAIIDFTVAIRLNKLNASAYYWRYLTKNEIMDFKGADADHKMAQKIDSKYVKEIDDFEQFAENEFSGLEEFCDPEKYNVTYHPVALGLFLKGCTEEEFHNYRKAIQFFNKAIENFPRYFEAYLERGLVKMMIKNYGGALKDFNILLKIDPGNTDVLSYKRLVKKKCKKKQN